MKKESKVILSISALALLVILAGAYLATAENNDLNSSNSSDSSNSTAKNWTSICSHINESVSERIQAFDEGKVKRINSYNNTERMIQNLIDKLKAKGGNTTLAEADLQNLQSAISQFNSDYSSFITKLEGLKVYTCGNSSGEFASQLKDAKAMLPILRNDSVKVREAVIKIRIDLMQARGNLLISKLGERENKTQQNYQRRMSQLGNRTERLGNRIQNMTSRLESRISRLENRTRN